MAIDMNTALAKYGWVGQLANSIPSLRDTFTAAAQNEWSPDEFQRQLEGTAWWQSNADSVRQLAIKQATDPATYQQDLANAANKVQLAANQMGRSVDPNALALQLLTNNWDDQQLHAAIGNSGGFQTQDAGALVGDAAQLNDHIRGVAQSYGIPYTDAYVNGAVTRIQSGQDTVDGVTNVLMNRAKLQYPQFASQIDAGQTVKDIADPWIQTYAKTLEVADSTVTLDDPAIKKALTQRNADGSATTQPLWQFERTLKDDPRYDQTTQARTDAYSTLAKVGRDFGFSA